MKIIFILMVMIFIHFLYETVSTNYLYKFKDMSSWNNKKMYKNDYICFIITDAYLWSFIILLPIIINIDYQITWASVMGLILNGILRSLIEELRINKKLINNITSQLCYIFQIVITEGVYIFIYRDCLFK